MLVRVVVSVVLTTKVMLIDVSTHEAMVNKQ